MPALSLSSYLRRLLRSSVCPHPTLWRGSPSSQIAQKIHACSDAHAPPSQKNDRPRDVVDLILLKRSVEEAGEPVLGVIKAACVDVFDARRTDALTLSRPARSWPCRVIQHAHWKIDYATAAAQGNLMMPIEEAVSVVNAWIDEIDAS